MTKFPHCAFGNQLDHKILNFLPNYEEQSKKPLFLAYPVFWFILNSHVNGSLAHDPMKTVGTSQGA